VDAQRDVDRGIAVVVVDVTGDAGATRRALTGRPLDVEEVIGERALVVRVQRRDHRRRLVPVQPGFAPVGARHVRVESGHAERGHRKAHQHHLQDPEHG